MTIILENYALPEKGPVEIKVNVSFEIKVTAEEARRKVNRWLIDQVSLQMGGLKPALVLLGERVVWRVPVEFTAPSVGRAGIVGEVDVEVNTGEMYSTPEVKRGIEQRATEIASSLPPFKPKKLPPEYLAKNRPSAPKTAAEEEPVGASKE